MPELIINHREIAAAVIFDTSERLLFQLRDNKPNILCPGRIGLFGGHREGNETFLECVVREIHEELGCFSSPERFEKIAMYAGEDIEVPGGTFRAEFFVLRNVRIDQIAITEGTLKIVELKDLSENSQAIDAGRSGCIASPSVNINFRKRARR
jgi:8-oxo-dGTP diphosphatase